jgi:hypothetical protein
VEETSEGPWKAFGSFHFFPLERFVGKRLEAPRKKASCFLEPPPGSPLGRRWKSSGCSERNAIGTNLLTTIPTCFRFLERVRKVGVNPLEDPLGAP